MTTPKVMKSNRPSWLTAFNFFLLPIISENFGYPGGYNSSNFRFITPFRSNPREWRFLKGINLFDGREFPLRTSRDGRPNVVVADTYKIVLNQLLNKPEPKSLAPDGFDKSNFKFIVPFESKRPKWKRLWGINLWDEQIYRITTHPNQKMDTVVPDSFRIVLRQYLGHPEVKSLAPDGNSCVSNTGGLLRRVSVLAGDVDPIGKETDRHWEQGGDPSMMDFSIKQYRNPKKMAVRDPSDRKRWRNQGVRYCQRKSGLSPATVSKILNGKEIKLATLTTLRRAMDG